MKILRLIMLSLLFLVYKHAEAQIHTELSTPSWKLIALRYDTQVRPLQFEVVFPDALKAIHNRVIELPGYIIPTKVGNSFSTFMLSIVPIESCPFCGSGDIPSMVEVKMIKPISWTNTPIKIRGRFFINDSGDKRSEFFLLDAVKL